MPVVVYSSLVGTSDTFRYGRWDGRRWRTQPIAKRGPDAVQLPQLGHHARPRGPVVGRAQPHDRRAERDRGASHAGPRRQLVPGPAHPRVELVQHPARDPARPERSAQARRALRLGLGQELPRVRHRRRDGHRRAPDSSPRPRRFGYTAHMGVLVAGTQLEGCRHRGDDRPRGHGRRLPGASARPRPRGRDQGHHARARRRRAHARALPERGARRRRRRAPERPARLRRRRRGRPGLSRDALRARRRPAHARAPRGPAVRPGARPRSRSRSATRWTRSTARATSIATSSRRTCCSTRPATSTYRTSGSPSTRSRRRA